MPQMGGGMAPPMAPPPMGPQMGPPPINPTNPTAGNGQSFGGDAGGRKTFSQYLQSMNKSFPPTPAAQDPMAGGIGGGAPSMPPLAMMGGGAVPRSTMIGREPHRLAYINPGEEMMLRASGGTGEPGPGGVPAFRGGAGGYGGFGEGFGFGGGGGGPGDGDRGDRNSVDIGFVNALADQVAEEQEAAAIADSNMGASPGQVMAQLGVISGGDINDGTNVDFAGMQPENIDFATSLGIGTAPGDPDFDVESAFKNYESTPTMGQGVNIDDIEEATALSGTPSYMFGDKQSFNAGKETGIQDPSGLSSFDDMTGIDDSIFSAPVNAQTPTGIQDPSGASDITQISQAMQNAVTEAPNVNEIANIQAADVYGLPNTGLDTSLSAAQFADTLNPQGPTFTPSIPELTGPALAEATMGAPIGDPAMDRREAALGDMNTPVQGMTLSDDVIASNQAALDNLDLSTKGLGPESKLDLNTAMDLVDDRIAVQKEIDDAGFNPLSLLPFGSLLGTSPKRRQKAITQVLNQSGGSGILGTGIGGATGILGTGATRFNPVYDKDGNFVGSQGVSDKSGETVSYMGDMQGNEGYFDSDGDNVEMSKAIEGYQEDIGGQGSPEGLDEPYNPCQPGFELDPNTNTCVPIDVVGGGGGSSGPIDLNPIIRPTTPVVTPDPVPPTPVVSPVLRMPKQFNMGGATSGSNLDGAIGRLLSSMS